MLYSKRRKNLRRGLRKRSTRKSYRRNLSNKLRIHGGRQHLSIPEVMEYRTVKRWSWKYILENFRISPPDFETLKASNVAKLEDFIRGPFGVGMYMYKEFEFEVNDLRDYFTLEEIVKFVENNEIGFSFLDLINKKFSVQELKNSGITLQQLKNGGLLVKHLKGPFLAKDFVELLHGGKGFTIKELTEKRFEQYDHEWHIFISPNGFTVKELREAGLTVDDFVREEGSLPDALFNIGYTYGEIKPVYKKFKEQLNTIIQEIEVQKQELITHIKKINELLKSSKNEEETIRYKQDIKTSSDNLEELNIVLKDNKDSIESFEKFFDRCIPTTFGIRHGERRDDCTIKSI